MSIIIYEEVIDRLDRLMGRIRELEADLRKANLTASSVGIERDHWKATAQALIGANSHSDWGKLLEGQDGQVYRELKEGK